MTKFYTAALASAALLALPVATQAFAQGTVGPVSEIRGTCPDGYSDGEGRASTSADICYPDNSSAPAVYGNPQKKQCASGYRSGGVYWCTDRPESTATAAPTFGNITKANANDRCPVGYWTSRDSATSCVSYYENRSPASRPKRGAACAANEVDEWGLYCTSKTTSLTRAEAEESAVSDVNRIYEDSAGQGATQGYDYENTPGLIGIFGRKGSGSGAAAQSSSGSSNTEPTPAANCTTTTSSTGAAIGGAIGGDAGAAIGGMLGGKRKKKKSGC